MKEMKEVCQEVKRHIQAVNVQHVIKKTCDGDRSQGRCSQHRIFFSIADLEMLYERSVEPYEHTL